MEIDLARRVFVYVFGLHERPGCCNVSAEGGVKISRTKFIFCAPSTLQFADFQRAVERHYRDRRLHADAWQCMHPKRWDDAFCTKLTTAVAQSARL